MSKRNSSNRKKPVQRVPQQLIFNLKVEQVLRAIYFGFEEGRDTLKVSPVGGTAIAFFAADEYVDIGIADAQGYRLNPASNSALITMGYHPTAVLLWLSQMRLNGEPVVRVHNDRLIALHSAVVNACHDVVFEYEHLELIKGKPRVVAKPILENYLDCGKPSLFA